MFEFKDNPLRKPYEWAHDSHGDSSLTQEKSRENKSFLFINSVAKTNYSDAKVTLK